jgi:hypothetical protein
MSALGHKRTLSSVRVMSALPPIADIRRMSWHVRFVPRADIRTTRFLETQAECIPTINRTSRCRKHIAYCKRNSSDSTMPAGGKEESNATCHMRSNLRA